MDCELALQDGASVGDALATAAARLDVKKPHARFLALHAASATFLRATGDALLGAQHTEALARAYGGSRVIADVEGTHSSPRNRRARDYCGAFLREHLHLGAAPPAGRVDRVPWDLTL